MNIPDRPGRKRILFVCIENSNRSQIAEACARMLGFEIIEAWSAGSRPSGQVNPKAIEAMRAVGYDLSTHRSKSLAEIPKDAYDAVVTMGCGDACPSVPAKLREEWDIPDPRELGPSGYSMVRDVIQEKVRGLLSRI